MRCRSPPGGKISADRHRQGVVVAADTNASCVRDRGRSSSPGGRSARGSRQRAPAVGGLRKLPIRNREARNRCPPGVETLPWPGLVDQEPRPGSRCRGWCSRADPIQAQGVTTCPSRSSSWERAPSCTVTKTPAPARHTTPASSASPARRSRGRPADASSTRWAPSAR